MLQALEKKHAGTLEEWYYWALVWIIRFWFFYCELNQPILRISSCTVMLAKSFGENQVAGLAALHGSRWFAHVEDGSGLYRSAALAVCDCLPSTFASWQSSSFCRLLLLPHLPEGPASLDALVNCYITHKLVSFGNSLYLYSSVPPLFLGT